MTMDFRAQKLALRQLSSLNLEVHEAHTHSCHTWSPPHLIPTWLAYTHPFNLSLNIISSGKLPQTLELSRFPCFLLP